MAGRPSSYTEELADLVCNQIARGESLRSICAADDFPTKETVLHWLVNSPDFYAKYARARQAQAEVMDEKILETAERCLAGDLDAHAAKVAIGAYQWRASKLQPKVYGDAMQLKHADHEGNAMHVKVTRVKCRED
jgi:hypothetical protein